MTEGSTELDMKKVVSRESNKTYYRVLHLPIWLWVFFILPGNLTYELYLHGPNRWHGMWLAVVFAICAWRGVKGRLPGVEHKPYVTHYGLDQPNLPYRVVCYTSAWIDLLVPFSLNLIGLIAASFSGKWILGDLYAWLYYPLALAVVAGAWFDLVPRAKRSTRHEGAEKAWFYVAIWTVVPSQVVIWGVWRLGGHLGLDPLQIAWARLAAFLLVGGFFFFLGWSGRLGRTARFHVEA
jgi:hypothetical protein